jgi:hypothetical protein
MSATPPSPQGRLATGIGFREPHYAEIVATRPAVGWFEVHAENYLGGGPRGRHLDELRRDWPVSVHGVGLSLGSAEGIDAAHLARLKALVDRCQPFVVSEHLSWSITDGIYLNDLLPLPYTEEALAVVAANVRRLQDCLGRRVLIENPSRYLRFAASGIPEAEFLAELVRRSGCGLLCDVNNIHVTCANVGGDPLAWLRALPAEAVGEIHLAGYHVNDADGVEILIDDHGSPVADPVWTLFEHAVARFAAAPVLIEWDSNLPDLSVLVAEAGKADRRVAAAEQIHADAA